MRDVFLPFLTNHYTQRKVIGNVFKLIKVKKCYCSDVAWLVYCKLFNLPSSVVDKLEVLFRLLATGRPGRSAGCLGTSSERKWMPRDKKGRENMKTWTKEKASFGVLVRPLNEDGGGGGEAVWSRTELYRDYLLLDDRKTKIIKLWTNNAFLQRFAI